MREIKLPASEEDMRQLHVGDDVAITGVMITARDAAHKYMVEESPPRWPSCSRATIIYHCGPVVKKEGERTPSSPRAPPPASARSPTRARSSKKYGVRGVIGKGGMGAKTLAACQEFGAVYLPAVGRPGHVLAKSVKR